MATRAYQPAPLDMLLAAIPSLPRPILARLTAAMIERMDEIDPDPELEDTEGNGMDVDERGNPLKGETPLPGQCEDDEDGDPPEATWREVDSWSPQTLRMMDPHGPDDTEDDDPREDNHDREEIAEEI